MKRLLLALLVIASSPLFAADQQPHHNDAQHNDCLLRAAHNADKTVTLGELRAWCEKHQPGPDRSPHEDALRARLALEHSSRGNPFVITPHNRNYVMPFSHYSNPRQNDPDRADQELQSNEIKFQISLKAPLYDNFWGDSTLYAAFTGVFFWQAYNEDESRPFREINFTPELFVAKPVDWQIGPVDSELIAFGLRHDSNGRDVPASRSWNRIYLRHISRIGPYYVSLMPWYRIPEQEKDDPLDVHGDDNPDIEKYMGNFELEVARAFGNHVLELKVRNNLRSENKGAGEINYSFPLNKRFKGLVQVFTGYGDSLINYDDYETRVSVGILLTDTL